ncbi:hypothetical protein FACS1894110_09440 [Spirochaetia bacterium]|nr:hypothetical protein FACS1894110_09440 [Spirochaetia bacterium]
MPSLRALQEFKYSFGNIGGEPAALAAQHIPLEDFPLPDHEAAKPAPKLAPAESPAGTAAPDSADAGLLSDADADLDFGAFLDTIPDDLPDISEGAGEPASEAESAPETDNDDFAIPDDLLNGLADDVESGTPDIPVEEPAGESVDIPDLVENTGSEASAEDFDLGDVGEDRDFGGQLSEPGLPPMNNLADAVADTSAGAESAADADIAEGPDLADDAAPAPDQSAELPPEQPTELPPEQPTELPPEQSAELPPEQPPVSVEIPDEFASGSGGADFPETDGADAPSDSFDDFNLEGGDKLPEDFAADSADSAKASGEGLEEFALPGLDEVLADLPAAKSGVKGKAGRTPDVAPSDDVEEIRLSDKDLAKFQETLFGYPLNLRVACEELIAEEVVTPEQMSQLIKLLVRGAPARETAALAGKILGRTIVIPKGFEKKTGAELEAQQSSFVYIFVHNFLPIFRLFMMIAVLAASVFYLAYQFIYIPQRAESIYKMGYERIGQGEYERANERFTQAFGIHRVKNWFYKYAEAFRDERQYRYAEEKYDELLNFYPRDKKGVLDYAALETWYLRNYEKADSLLRRNILDYEVNDYDALLALGDNALAWGEIDYDRYEDARFAYARLLDQKLKPVQIDLVMERMMKFFIRTDNLKEVLPLQSYFMDYPKRKISGASLAELGGYLMDKRTEKARGVPNEYIEQIQGVRDVLLRAVKTAPALPEGHYHLSRYYRNLSDFPAEQDALETAIRAFDAAREESVKRLAYRIAAQQRYANVLTDQREFFAAEEQLVKGIGLYEDGLSRQLLNPSPEYGKLYADLGDLEYFTKAGNMDMALQYYLRSEQNGWAPPEIQYRMGNAYYRQEQWPQALERFFAASSELPLNRRILLALGNVTYQRGDYLAAQGYYNRLLDILEAERSRLPMLMPNERPEYIDLAERLMITRNNMGVTLEALSRSLGSIQPRVLDRYRSRALGLYTDSARAWDSLTRNPNTMVRLGAGDFSAPGINLAFLNSRNALYPVPDYEPRIYPQIDKDVLEPSIWEELTSQPARLTE